MKLRNGMTLDVTGASAAEYRDFRATALRCNAAELANGALRVLNAHRFAQLAGTYDGIKFSILD